MTTPGLYQSPTIQAVYKAHHDYNKKILLLILFNPFRNISIKIRVIEHKSYISISRYIPQGNILIKIRNFKHITHIGTLVTFRTDNLKNVKFTTNSIILGFKNIIY